jgi:NAD(P)-dependent dehydrogenase (short-subunit alcohol dehydrogenase family)
VTGGARGVTADCAIELARRTGGTFVLLGRSSLAAWPDWLEPQSDIKALRGLLARNSSRAGMPKKPVEIDRLARRLMASAEISSTISAIEAVRAKALYVQADIGHAAEAQRVIAAVQQSEGSITGLVHGAGVLSDGRVETLQLQDFDKVFAPKVEGFETVLSCLATNRLRHVAVFSSASAVFGNEGQANYAAANSWLNNVAEQLSVSLPNAQVKAFCWGPWQGGMVDDALARMFTERGIGLISRSEGARIFADQLLLSPHEQVRFVIGDEWGA